MLISCVSCKDKQEESTQEVPSYNATLNCPDAENDIHGAVYKVQWRERYNFPLPTRQHYEFVNWSNGEDKLEATGFWPYSFDVELTAVWKPENYFVSYNMMPYYDVEYESYTVESESFYLKTPKFVPGKMFIGWTADDMENPQKAVLIPNGSYGNRKYTANWIESKEIDNQLDGFVFEIVDDHAVVVGYCGEMKSQLTIPSEYQGYPVTVIGNSAFYGMGIFTGLLKIPYSVTKIEDFAIGECKNLPMSIYGGEFEAWKENVVIGIGNGALNEW